MSDKKIDNLYAALMLIEILLEKGLINQATYSNIVKMQNRTFNKWSDFFYNIIIKDWR